jgi:hypothetical protein
MEIQFNDTDVGPRSIHAPKLYLETALRLMITRLCDISAISCDCSIFSFSCLRLEWIQTLCPCH